MEYKNLIWEGIPGNIIRGVGRQYKICHEASYYCGHLKFNSTRELWEQVQNTHLSYATRGVRELGYLSTKPHHLWVEGILGGVYVLVLLP